jgi:hypothetical protein
MRSHSIEVPSPLLDQGTCLLERVEDFPVQEIVPQLPDQRLDVSFLPPASGFDEQYPHAPNLGSHSRTALAQNSGPLSYRICVGMPLTYPLGLVPDLYMPIREEGCCVEDRIDM